MKNREKLAEQTGNRLLEMHLMLTTAESCTGGGVAHAITEIAGSSQWFDRGFVTYTNVAKQEMLGVQATTLEKHGAVSLATVEEMIAGALRFSHAQVALAISGIAGPGGGTLDKPVGTVCFGWGREGGDIFSTIKQFTGNRSQVREQAVEYALEGTLNLLNK